MQGVRSKPLKADVDPVLIAKAADKAIEGVMTPEELADRMAFENRRK